jgi:hypothetical protein
MTARSVRRRDGWVTRRTRSAQFLNTIPSAHISFVCSLCTDVFMMENNVNLLCPSDDFNGVPIIRELRWEVYDWSNIEYQNKLITFVWLLLLFVTWNRVAQTRTARTALPARYHNLLIIMCTLRMIYFLLCRHSKALKKSMQIATWRKSGWRHSEVFFQKQFTTWMRVELFYIKTTLLK